MLAEKVNPPLTDADKLDAERWRYVRDHGLVWQNNSFRGTSTGRIGDQFAVDFVDFMRFSKGG